MSLTAGPRGRNTGHGAARERACVRATSEARSPSPARCPEPSGRTRRHNDRYARHRTHQPRAEEGHRGHAQPGAPRPRSPLRLRTSGPLGGWVHCSSAPSFVHSLTRELVSKGPLYSELRGASQDDSDVARTLSAVPLLDLCQGTCRTCTLCTRPLRPHE